MTAIEANALQLREHAPGGSVQSKRHPLVAIASSAIQVQFSDQRPSPRNLEQLSLGDSQTTYSRASCRYRARTSACTRACTCRPRLGIGTSISSGKALSEGRTNSLHLALPSSSLVSRAYSAHRIDRASLNIVPRRKLIS